MADTQSVDADPEFSDVASKAKKRDDDPVLRHARREGLIIAGFWLLAVTWTIGYCGLFGYRKSNGEFPPLETILGIPTWVFWGIFVPWACLAIGTIIFVLGFMKEDDLGRDHAEELDRDIRVGGEHAHHQHHHHDGTPANS